MTQIGLVWPIGAGAGENIIWGELVEAYLTFVRHVSMRTVMTALRPHPAIISIQGLDPLERGRSANGRGHSLSR